MPWPPCVWSRPRGVSFPEPPNLQEVTSCRKQCVESVGDGVAGSAAGADGGTGAGSAAPPAAAEGSAPQEMFPEVDEAKFGNWAKVAQVVAFSERDNVDLIQPWRQAADRLVRQYARLVVAPSTESGWAEEVRQSSLARAKGDLTGLTLIHFDAKLAGEAVTNPHVRTCPLQDQPYKRSVAGILKGRADVPLAPNPVKAEAASAAEDDGGSDAAAVLKTGDLVALIDGGKYGNERSLIAPWKPPATATKTEDDDEDDAEEAGAGGKICKRILTLSRDEQTLRARRGRAKGTACLAQTEHLILLTPSPLNLPERDCKLGGSNRGTVCSSDCLTCKIAVYTYKMLECFKLSELPWWTSKTSPGAGRIIKPCGTGSPGLPKDPT